MRRLLLVIIAAILLAGMAASAAAVSSSVQAQEDDKPNIVFIMADDMRTDDIHYMPKTNALLKDEGTEFARFYATFPLCCPSRATFLSGRYTHNHGVKSNLNGAREFKPLESSTVAVALDNAGYETALIGKYMNGYNGYRVPPGWDEWHAKLDPDGLSTAYYNYTINENGVKVDYGKTPEDYQTDVLARKGEEFVRNTPVTEPLFLYLTPSAPHYPATPADRHMGVYEGDPHQDRGEALLAVDEMVERVYIALQDTGRLENTYIFFVSDNGWMYGEHGLNGGKHTFYEESVRVPLLIRGPGLAPGRVDERIVGNTDLAPTWADLGGTSMPSTVDGRSFVPLFNGEDVPWRTYYYINNPTDKRGPYKGVITPRHKFIDKKNGKLFDYLLDPSENTDFAHDADPALLESLRSKVAELKACSGDSCRTAEDS